jgi:hypothetical protein
MGTRYYVWPLILLATSVAIISAHSESNTNCSNDSGAVAVDLSSPVDQHFLEKMKQIGITTIIRYFDHVEETIKGKTLRRNERDLILMNGFKIAVVFQHNNDKFSTFTPERGDADAERSLVLAHENLQPSGSAIYFGVDGPWKDPDQLDNIKSYFSRLKARLAGSGYRIGIYGSGLVCRQLIGGGFAELCWLANPVTWPEYSKYKATRQWKLLQLRFPRGNLCAGHAVDFDVTNGVDTEFGQFGF